MSSFVDESTKYSSEVSRQWFQQKKYIWQSDGLYEECSYCKKPLTSITIDSTFQKHHSRCCGKVICSICSRAPANVILKKGCVERCCPDCWPELEEALKPRVIKCSNPPEQPSKPTDPNDSISPIPIDI